jgi:UDP-N-acetylglucosamine/UDP-N-acetylgalactosamine diphosphorylase
VSPAAAAAAALRERGLESVLEAARRAGDACAERLLRELAALDWRQLDRQRAALAAAVPAPAAAALEAPPLLPHSGRRDLPEVRAAEESGWEELRAGRAAVLTVAGGQASRLGFDGPKGAYPLGPVSGASLFQILAGQIARLRERSGAALPWILMTGPENDAATREHFARRSHFGLARGSVRFAMQGMLPALTPAGELLLAAPDRLFRNPDGHGGLFRALARAGLWEELRAAGVRTVFSCQVDNPLARVADPAFLGFHLLHGARMSCKAVVKTDPAERVGVLALRAGRLECIEYSDLPHELQERRATDGGLTFRAGNVAMHVLDLGFAAEIAAGELPLHLARKEVLALDAGLVPRRCAAVKFETFVFDALARAGVGGALVQEAERSEEFAPLKNRDGNDSAATARGALYARARRWMAAAGLQPAAAGLVEIEAGFALDAEDLRARIGSAELVAGRLLRRRRVC